MVRTSRRQTLLRTTLPAVEHVEPSEETAIDFSSQPADEADQLTAETDRVQEAEQRIDADRLLPVLIQEMNLPQEAKDHLYQEIQRVRQHPHLSPPQTPPSRPLNPYAPSGWNQQPPTMPPRVNPHNPQTQQQQLGEALADLNALQQRIQTLLAPPQQPPPVTGHATIPQQRSIGEGRPQMLADLITQPPTPRPLKRYLSRSASRLRVHVFVNLSGPTPKPPTKIYPHTQPTPTTHTPTNTQHRSIPNGQQTSNNRPP